MLYIVIAVVVFSLLAGLMARNYSVSTRITARPDCQKAARLMAESGVRYAMSQLRTAPNETVFNDRVAALNDHTFTLGNGSSFRLSVTGSGTSYTVGATGNAPCLEGDPVSAGLSHTFSVKSLGSGIAFNNGDLSGFEVVSGAGGTNAISVHNDTTNPANSYVELGGTIYAAAASSGPTPPHGNTGRGDIHKLATVAGEFRQPAGPIRRRHGDDVVQIIACRIGAPA
jgi:hypothetical protein